MGTLTLSHSVRVPRYQKLQISAIVGITGLKPCTINSEYYFRQQYVVYVILIGAG